MTNKIPQEIEEDLTLREIGIGGIGYEMGFKAGQEQSNEEELKFLKTLTFPRSNIYIFSSISIYYEHKYRERNGK